MNGALLEADEEEPATAEAPAARASCRGVLVYVCLLTISVLIFFDRGAFAALVILIEDTCEASATTGCVSELSLSKHEVGFVGGAFVFGFAVASVVMAQLARICPHGVLMCCGLLLWAGAEVWTAWAASTTSLVLARCLTGVGEAVFVPISSLLVQDVAPKGQTNLWLGMYFMTQALGFALGNIVSGLAKAWHLTFTLEAVLMVPVAVAALFLPNARGSENLDELLSSAAGERGELAGGGRGAPEHDGAESDVRFADVDGSVAPTPSRRARFAQLLQRTARELRSSLVDLLRVLVNPLFVCATAGYAFVTFTLGALSFWMPAYEVEMYGMSLELASSSLGLSIIFSAIVSNIGVSLLLDLVTSSPESGGKRRGIPNTVAIPGVDADAADADGEHSASADEYARRVEADGMARDAEPASGASGRGKCARKCDCCRLGLDPALGAFVIGLLTVVLSATFSILASTVPPTPLDGNASEGERAAAQGFFIVILFIGIFWTLSAAIVPAPVVILNCVAPEQRGLAMSASVLAIHVFGDMWSPYIFGWIFECRCRLPLVIVTLWELGAVAAWVIGAALSARKHHGGVRALAAALWESRQPSPGPVARLGRGGGRVARGFAHAPLDEVEGAAAHDAAFLGVATEIAVAVVDEDEESVRGD